VIGWLTDPYAYDFMRRALGASLIVGIVAPLVGVWVVLRRLAYLGDAMSHASLAGVAAASALGFSLTLGALGAGLAMAALMAVLAAHPRISEDSVIGAAEVALFALGLLIIASAGSGGVDLSHILLGSMNTVSPGDLWTNAALGLAVLVALAVCFDDLRSATFDPLHAHMVGVRVTGLRHGLFALVAVAIVLALQTVGLLLSIALFVLPAATARLCTRTAVGMSVAAAITGATVTATGLTLAFHLATPPGATIALLAAAVLAAAWAVTLPRRGHAPAGHAHEHEGAPEPATP